MADLEMKHLDTMTSGQLWDVVHQRNSDEDDTRFDRLALLRKVRPLKVAEQADYDRIYEDITRQMLERTRALLLLKQRGHDVARYLNPQDYEAENGDH